MPEGNTKPCVVCLGSGHIETKLNNGEWIHVPCPKCEETGRIPLTAKELEAAGQLRLTD